MDEKHLEFYWNFLPVGKESAIDYPAIMSEWNVSERAARSILHDLSLYDNGDDYILIRSSGSKGFYKTDDPDEIKAYKRECLHKGRSVFAPVKKINRVLACNDKQFSFENNLRVIREAAGMRQGEVCKLMKKHGCAFDKSMLSKMENGICMPTPYQAIVLSQIYGCEPSELFSTDLYL